MTSARVSPRSPLFILLRTLHHFHNKITVFSRSSYFNCIVGHATVQDQTSIVSQISFNARLFRASRQRNCFSFGGKSISRVGATGPVDQNARPEYLHDQDLLVLPRYVGLPRHRRCLGQAARPTSTAKLHEHVSDV